MSADLIVSSASPRMWPSPLNIVKERPRGVARSLDRGSPRSAQGQSSIAGQRCDQSLVVTKRRDAHVKSRTSTPTLASGYGTAADVKGIKAGNSSTENLRPPLSAMPNGHVRSPPLDERKPTTPTLSSHWSLDGYLRPSPDGMAVQESDYGKLSLTESLGRDYTA